MAVSVDIRGADIVAGLEATRQHTLALVAPLSREDLERQIDPLMSPLVWDLAHIAAYEDLWLVHRHGGEPLLRADLAEIYDAFETPRAVRGDLALPRPRRRARVPRRRARARAGRRIERTAPTPCCTSSSCATSSSTPRRCCRRCSSRGSTATRVPRAAPPPRRARRRTAAWSSSRSPAAPCTIGAPEDGFAYDNERPRHAVDLPAFRIGRTPVTNATWLRFAEGGGYERREWWSRRGLGVEGGVRHHAPQALGRGRTDGAVAIDRLGAAGPRRARRPRLLVRGRRLRPRARRAPPDRGRVGEGGDLGPAAGGRAAPVGRTSPRRDANLGRVFGPRPARTRRRLAVRRARHARRRLGVDRERVRAATRLRRPPLPRVLRGLLRRRLPRAARRLVGDPRARRHADVPQLGPPAAPPDLLRRAARDEDA